MRTQRKPQKELHVPIKTGIHMCFAS